MHSDTAYLHARRAYELGRVKHALFRATFVATAVALVAIVSVGRSAAVWAPLSFVALFLTEWRGTALMHGARRGALVGAVTLLVPIWVLRPCCGPNAEMMMQAGAVCTEPSCCIIVGALLGVLASFALPRAVHASPRATVAGFALGAVSVAAVRCAPLFWGEAVGLVSGLSLALVVASAARTRFATKA
jgi:hypothetical protein